MITILSKPELDRLEKVIGEVEEKTSGEVRLMIVRRSAVTGHVQVLLWCMLITITFVVLWFGRDEVIFWERWWLWPALVSVHYVIAGLLARLEPVQRQLTSVHDLHHQVWARAEVEFHREGLSDTSSHTGVLLFVSLMERQALVLADKAIADRVPEGTWNQVVKTIVQGAQTGRWADKLEQALREVGSYLADHFPPQPGKGNELPNAVILKD